MISNKYYYQVIVILLLHCLTNYAILVEADNGKHQEYSPTILQSKINNINSNNDNSNYNTLDSSDIGTLNVIINYRSSKLEKCKGCILQLQSSTDQWKASIDFNQIQQDKYKAVLTYNKTIFDNSQIELNVLLNFRIKFTQNNTIPLLKDYEYMIENCYGILYANNILRNLGPSIYVVLNSSISTPSFQELELYPFFCTQVGKHEEIRRVYSKQLNNYRTIHVLLPPSFIENDIPRKMHVLVQNDGEFSNWAYRHTLDNLQATGQIIETLVIGVSATVNRSNEMTPWKCQSNCSAGCPGAHTGDGFNYLDFIIDDVVPMVLKKYAITTDRESMSMSGISLGGLMACTAAFYRSDKHFSSFYCSSPSLQYNCNELANLIENQLAKPKNDVKVFIDYGTGEGRLLPIGCRQTFRSMINTGWIVGKQVWLGVWAGDRHEANSWLRRFHVAITTLFSAKNTYYLIDNPQESAIFHSQNIDTDNGLDFFNDVVISP